MKKTVFITGAVTNTGFGVAEKFASEGYNVFITSRQEEKVNEAVEKLRAKYPDVLISGYELNAVKPDNTVDEARIKEIFSDLDKRGVTVDYLVLNAANLGIR